MTDATHDPVRTSWVASANGHAEFPIQNLPFGVFSVHGGRPRGGVAIGDAVFDIAAALEAGLFAGATRDAAEAAVGPVLNPLQRTQGVTSAHIGHPRCQRRRTQQGAGTWSAPAA
jgi:fumarylacetoacetase